MIKLFEVYKMENGTRGFQSQLYVGSDTVDFVMGNDNTMRCYGHGENGFDFYEYKEPYEIISNIKEMQYQKL